MSKEKIFGQLDLAIGTNSALKVDHAKDIAFKQCIKMPSDDLLESYKINQLENKSEIIETTEDRIIEEIKKILKDTNAKKIAYSTDLPIDIESANIEGAYKYNKPIEEMKDELFRTDTSIIMAQAGVADLGVVALASSASSPRLLSLAVNHCIILLKKSSIVESMLDAIKLLKSKALPTNMLLIAGPSRTADIELKTVFGVHGPRAVYVILY